MFAHVRDWVFSGGPPTPPPPPPVLRGRVKTVVLSWLGLLVFVANVVPGDRVVPAGVGLLCWLLWVGFDNIEAIPGMSTRLGGLYGSLAFFFYSFGLPVTAFYLALPLLQLRDWRAAAFAFTGLAWVLLLSYREYRGIYQPLRRPVAAVLYVACLAIALWVTRSTAAHVPAGVPLWLWLGIWLVLGLLAAVMFYAVLSGWRMRGALFGDHPGRQ